MKKGKRKSNITESIEKCTKTLTNLLTIYSALPKEYSYMAYNTLLIGKIFERETPDELNNPRHNMALIKLKNILTQYENLSLMTENNHFQR